MNKIKFSLPLYPGLDEKYMEKRLIPFLIKNKNIIFDIYFTSRIPPFEQDAMGTLFNKDDIAIMISNAILIQEETAITVSATFNNKFISPSYENFKIWIENFKILYEYGIRSVTIPFTSWLLFKEIKKEFPNLYIKNTVLWALKEPREVYNAFLNGFDYVNLDRNLLRNINRLKKIDKARKKAEKKLNKKLKLSILFNENCIGNCPIQEEHFLYNVNNNFYNQNKIFFRSKMNKISCTEWEKNDIVYDLKKANVINDMKYLNELNMIDVFKLHGRENKFVFESSLNIIEAFNNNELYFDNFHYFKEKHSISTEKWDKWIEVIKNCNFDCWDCDECEKLIL